MDADKARKYFRNILGILYLGGNIREIKDGKQIFGNVNPERDNVGCIPVVCVNKEFSKRVY